MKNNLKAILHTMIQKTTDDITNGKEDDITSEELEEAINDLKIVKVARSDKIHFELRSKEKMNVKIFQETWKTKKILGKQHRYTQIQKKRRNKLHQL